MRLINADSLVVVCNSLEEENKEATGTRKVVVEAICNTLKIILKNEPIYYAVSVKHGKWEFVKEEVPAEGPATKEFIKDCSNCKYTECPEYREPCSLCHNLFFGSPSLWEKRMEGEGN